MLIDRILGFHLIEDLVHESNVIDALEIGLSHLVFASVVPIPVESLWEDGNKMIRFGDAIKVSQIDDRLGTVSRRLGAMENEHDRNRFLQMRRYEYSKGSVLASR
jgi:hypothetical protein